MPDLGPAAGALLDIGAPIVGRAFKAFASSAAASFVLGVVVCVGAWIIASRHSTLHGAIAVGIALVLFAALGAVLAVKRAVLDAVLHAFQKLALGSRTTKLVFDRIRGTRVQSTAERVPLAVAEGKLRSAVDALVAEDAGSGFFRRKIRAAAIEKVSMVTLARFRAEGEGGVDLAKVELELIERIDGLVADTARTAALKLTALFLGGATAASMIAAYLLAS